jgi:pimeloyl-ACP methyl ester carboxylesterase
MTGDRIVILIHGIRTRALWMDEVKPALESDGFFVAPTSYGRYGLLRFLMPGEWLRQRAIDRVVTDIVTARRISARRTGQEPASMSVIAHSFGTYVLSRIIADHPELQWNRIIFCGSVVREDFPLHQYLDRFDVPILNEIGTRDFWPALAESVGWGYGSVGSTGFNRPPVTSRWHKGFTHSQFLSKKFCRTQWIPFLRDGEISPGDAASSLPSGIQLLTSIPLRWLPPAVLFLLLAFCVVLVRLPFYPNGPHLLIPEHNDVITSVPDQAPFSSFVYIPNGSSQFTVPKKWLKMTDTAGIKYWSAINEEGGDAPIRFDPYHRIIYNNCFGTVVLMQGSPENQVFIPDKRDGCSNHQLRSRNTAFSPWIDLGEVKFGE